MSAPPSRGMLWLSSDVPRRYLLARFYEGANERYLVRLQVIVVSDRSSMLSASGARVGRYVGTHPQACQRVSCCGFTV